MKDFEELRKAHEAYMAERIRNTPLEQRLAGVAPEELARALTPEQLAALLAQLPRELLEAAAKKRAS